MERYTSRYDNGQAYFAHPNYDCTEEANALAAYEDTGLMPDEIAHLYAELSSYQQIKKACNDTGFDDFEALLAGYQQVKSDLAEAKRREKAAVEDSTLRKGTELTPIYTCGGHMGYDDDDDEDFWCPICHAHLGTHRGYKTTCPRCGQQVNHDSEPLYNYRDMKESESEWRGPEQEGGE